MDENPSKTRKQLEAQLIDRAMQDETFRQELRRDPKGVVARELGIRVPENFTLQVLEEDPTTVYLVLPSPVARAGAELSDAELEGVAGGYGSVYPTCDGWSTCDSCDGGVLCRFG